MRGELETGTDCYILTQSSSDHSSTSSSFCWAAQPWVTKGRNPLSEAGSHSAGILSPTAWNWLTRTDWLQVTNCNWLTQAVCGTWLYNCLTSTCFLWAYASVPNSTTSTSQGDIPTSSTGCTCLAVLLLFYTCAYLDWQLGRGSICNSNIYIYIYIHIYIYVCMYICIRGLWFLLAH